MSSLRQRFILAGVALPVIFAVLLLLPDYTRIIVGLAASVFSGLGAVEMSRMFGRKSIPVGAVQAFLSGAVLPLAAWIDESGLLQEALVQPVLFLALGLIVARRAFVFRSESLKGSLEKAAAGFFLVLYPGLFMSYLPRIASLEYPGLSTLLFLCLVFSNDSAAYGAGMLFGGGNRNIFIASPNKSAAGLIGGFAGAAGCAYIFDAFHPELFGGTVFLPPVSALLCSFAANAGDLAESAMKRSAEVKDSGKILKGRGGVMDSIDSILYAAPVFYYAALFLARQVINR